MPIAGTMPAMIFNDPKDYWSIYAANILAIKQDHTPTLLRINDLAPHLPPDVIAKIYHRGVTKRLRTYFCGPPLKVHGALQVFCIDSRLAKSGLYSEPIVYHAFVQRRPVSYINHPEIKAAALEPEFEGYELAEEYACTHWPDDMTYDESSAVMVWHLVPVLPTDGPMTVTAWLGDSYPEVLSDGSEPGCELLDDSLFEISAWEPVAHEMSAGHVKHAGFACRHCGGGIVRRQECYYCLYCEAVSSLSPTTPNWPYALPRTAADTFENIGHKFLVPTLEARKAEHRTWAASNYLPVLPPEYKNYNKQRRSLEL